MAPVHCENSSKENYKLASEKLNSQENTRYDHRNNNFFSVVTITTREVFGHSPRLASTTKKHRIPEKTLQIYPVIWVDAFFMQAKKGAPQHCKHKLRQHLQLWEL
jgi:hypothetical protein